MRLAILVSGRGSNLEAVLEAVADGRLPHVEPVLVVSNRPGARALEVAARHRVPSATLPVTAFADRRARDAQIGRALTDAGAELALLAGYDQLLDRSYFAAFAGRTINIHPSLLPRHGGRGMIGLAVHRAVLAAGDPETGVTIHEVSEQLDAGPILAQSRVAVRTGEEEGALAKRVLRVEHGLLVTTLAGLANEPWSGTPSATMAGTAGAADAPSDPA